MIARLYRPGNAGDVLASFKEINRNFGAIFASCSAAIRQGSIFRMRTMC